MLSKGTPAYERVARTIDAFMAVDLTGVGLIGHLYAAARKHQEGPLCMAAAELIAATLRGKGGPALIATGFPEGGGVPETDGPVGAAMLVRALLLGLGVESVIVIDEDWEPVMRATCLGAGLRPMPFPASGIIETIDFLRPVYLRPVPKDAAGCHRICDDLLVRTRPRLLVAIERPGCNGKGVYHGLGGRPLGGMVADLDHLFREAREKGIPSIGFGDGGNELGMGVIKRELREFSPKAVDCGCLCHGGVAADTATDLVVVSSVSNWGITGVIVALSALLEKAVVFHEPELEVRSIEMCAGSGGVDGMFEGTEPFVDGIPAKEWEGLIHTLRATVRRALGMSVNWKGEMGDWRQLT